MPAFSWNSLTKYPLYTCDECYAAANEKDHENTRTGLQSEKVRIKRMWKNKACHIAGLKATIACIKRVSVPGAWKTKAWQFGSADSLCLSYVQWTAGKVHSYFAFIGTAARFDVVVACKVWQRERRLLSPVFSVPWFFHLSITLFVLRRHKRKIHRNHYPMTRRSEQFLSKWVFYRFFGKSNERHHNRKMKECKIVVQSPN